MRMGEDYQWYAVTTRYKCEKFVADKLARKGIETYVPLLAKTRRYTRKIKTYQIPLISCYAFVRISRKELVHVLNTLYVIDLVRFAGDIIPIKETEIDILRRVVGEIKELQVEQKSLLRGDRVEIVSGNLTGIQGILQERFGRQEFVVELDTLGYQMRMTIDARVLRKICHTEVRSSA